LEYNGELTHGDPIMLVAEFNLPSPEEREVRKQEIKAEIEATSRRLEGGSVAEEPVSEDEPASEPEAAEDDPKEDITTDVGDNLPSAPDLDALSDE
jgi:hypothetical protein